MGWFTNLSRKRQAALVTAASLVAAVAALSESIINIFSDPPPVVEASTKQAPAQSPVAQPADQPAAQGNSLTVVHNVEHRSGTGSTDVLSGEDHFIVRQELLDRPENSAPTVDHTDFEFMPVTHCAPFDLRTLNATQSYVALSLAVFETDNMSQIGIGPGERSLSRDLDAGDYVLSDDRRRFMHYFRVTDC